MGGCVSKSPQKIVPYSNGDNLATAKNTKSENAFHDPPAEQTEDRTNQGKKDESPFSSKGKSKEVDSQLRQVNNNTKLTKTGAAGHVQNGMAKAKGELPKLIKTCAFRGEKMSKMLREISRIIRERFNNAFDDLTGGLHEQIIYTCTCVIVFVKLLVIMLSCLVIVSSFKKGTVICCGTSMANICQ